MQRKEAGLRQARFGRALERTYYFQLCRYLVEQLNRIISR